MPAHDIPALIATLSTASFQHAAGAVRGDASVGSPAGETFLCEGRRPLGHVEQSGQGSDPLGRALAGLAHLEEAAIDAFVELQAILAAHGAPAELLERCHQAAEDERLHAALLTVLALRRGGTVPRPRAEPVSCSLLDLALANAVEGCVHETWAALEAALIAHLAAEPDVRAAFSRIADDEARHAQLSWDLHAWLSQQLPEHWHQVEAAQARALHDLPGHAARSSALAPLALGLPAAPAALAADLAGRLAA